MPCSYPLLNPRLAARVSTDPTLRTLLQGIGAKIMLGQALGRREWRRRWTDGMYEKVTPCAALGGLRSRVYVWEFDR